MKPSGIAKRTAGLLRRLLFHGQGERTQAIHHARMRFRGIDLSWTSTVELGLDSSRCEWHSNSGGPLLSAVFARQGVGTRDGILDLGCGKGGALITMAAYPFAAVDGVEISDLLANIARRNLTRLGLARCRVFCCDAAEFRDLDPYTHFYMYNPFSGIVLESVLANIHGSASRSPRGITIIYTNPVHENLLLRSGFHRIELAVDGAFRVGVYSMDTHTNP